MRITSEIATTANTARAAPKTTVVPVPLGSLNQVTVQYAYGQAWLVGVRVRRALHQIVPATEGVWLRGDNETIVVPEARELDSEPAQLEIDTHNDDDLYDHTVIVHFDILPKDANTARTPGGILNRLGELFGVTG